MNRAPLAERHLPVAVEGAARIDADGERTHLRVAAPAAGEKIAERRLDRGMFLAVPIDAQDEIAPAHIGRRDPDLLDRARRPRSRRAASVSPGAIRIEGEIFQPRPSPRAWIAPVPSSAIPPSALLAGRILGADRARLGVRKPRQIAEMQTETREAFTHSDMRPIFAWHVIHLMPLVLINSMMRFWKMTNIASVGMATTVEAAMM